MPPARRYKCSFRERGRRCPRDGTGNPPLCAAHQIAFQEAARPRRPTEVIAEAVVNFMQGEPVNAAATIHAFDALFGQGIGAGYHPDLGPGGHRVPGASNAPGWWTTPREPPVDPRVAEAHRAQLDARAVLGFAPRETLTPELVKAARRKMAKRYHSDRTGGSDARMQIINNAADVLLQSLA